MGTRKRTRHPSLSFFSLIDHDDHPDPIFWRLYLGPQLRYKPSAASTLSPTLAAINRCPLIAHLLRGLLLRKPIPTAAAKTTKRMLWCCFHTFHFTDGHPSGHHRFRIVIRSGRYYLGPVGKFICSKSVLLCAKIIKILLKLPRDHSQLQTSGPKPPPNDQVRRVWLFLRCGRQGGASFTSE